MLFKDKVYYKYLTVSQETKKWGLYLTGAGYTDAAQKNEYPLSDHPDHHYFTWSKGRRLTDFQVLYITEGRGIFESEKSGIKKVQAGDIFLLFPNVWHRFSPQKATGWKEYWIEFNGYFAQYLMCNHFLNPGDPVISLGLGEELIDKFLKVIHLVKKEEITYQFSASAELMYILARIASGKVESSFNNRDLESQIRRAKQFIDQNMNLAVSPQSIASDLGVSYSFFRSQFKKYTGFSPLQYQIQLRIKEAREMLIRTDLSIKEISMKLGFETSYYFSRLFKEKVGKSPSSFREDVIRR